MFKRVLLLSCASGSIGFVATAAHAATAQNTASSAASTTSSVTELVVTAEKREQQLQHVAIAITAFTAAKRDEMGINSIQDMTNFTPGLTYSTSTDRITLRGVGRTTNVLSADAPVANYDDDLYETFAVAAGRSSLELAQVVVDRGPQGTLGGRNALAGALNEITQRPTSTPQAEFRWTVGNYGHLTAEAAMSGPLNDVWQYRIYGNWDYQSQGWINNIVPGQPSEGNNINEWYVDAQIQAHFNDHFDMWTKFQSAGWSNPSGGPGDQSAGWFRLGSYPTALSGPTGLLSTIAPAAGFACAPGAAGEGVTNVVNLSPAGCVNPSLNSPWTEAIQTDHSVSLPSYYSINSQWTWHADGFDIKYIGGGTYYHYKLWGPTGGNNAPIFAYDLGSTEIRPTDSFTYQELNGFWSDELNFISTGNGPLQWVAGVYQFYQHYQQPVSAENLEQPGLANNAPSFGFCGTNPPSIRFTPPPFCAPVLLGRYFDNRPDVQDQSYAAYGQIDYKFTPEWKLTLGIRYSYDNKYGTESIRLLCWFVCGTGTLALDLTSDGAVVDSGVPGPLPKGVTGVTTYSTKYPNLATRAYNASWSDPSGTAGIEFTPDNDSLYYFKYGRGYKSGGYNIGIFTVLSFEPWTASETVDSFEVGAKHTWGHWLTADVAAYWYNYTNLQIPIAQVQTAGGLAQSETSFYNVPQSVSRGIELETTWTPIENLSILFNYSFSDAYVTKGEAPDPADPNALEPGAQPALSVAACKASIGKPGGCTADVFSATGWPGPNPYAGLNVPQNLAGNPLPNAPRNKIAINVLYDYKLSTGAKLEPSISYVWRDQQWGLFFKDPSYIAPAWDEWDARLSISSPNDRFEAIFFIKNIANTVGYDQGAISYRAAGTTATGVNYVQGLNGPAGFNEKLIGADRFGVYQELYVTPPRTYGVELHYKFF